MAFCLAPSRDVCLPCFVEIIVLRVPDPIDTLLLTLECHSLTHCLRIKYVSVVLGKVKDPAVQSVVNNHSSPIQGRFVGYLLPIHAKASCLTS